MVPVRSFAQSIQVLSLLLVALAFSGCGGPMLAFPGGELSGPEATTPVADWSFASDSFLELETRPSDPYSVQLNYFVRDGNLYIDPNEGKRWLDHLRENPEVRVRLGGQVYPLRATLVGQPGQLEGFDADRFIYRLDAR